MKKDHVGILTAFAVAIILFSDYRGRVGAYNHFLSAR